MSKFKIKLAEASAFNKRVENWKNDPRNKNIVKYNKMNTKEYMEEVNSRGFKTELSEKDFHALQEQTFWASQVEYLLAIKQESDIMLSFYLELLKGKDPKEYESLTKAMFEHEKAENEELSKNENEEDKGETEMAKEQRLIKDINAREKTVLMGTSIAAFDTIFKNMRAINEIMYAVYASEIEDMREKQVGNVREEKVSKEQPKKVEKVKK